MITEIYEWGAANKYDHLTIEGDFAGTGEIKAFRYGFDCPDRSPKKGNGDFSGYGIISFKISEDSGRYHVELVLEKTGKSTAIEFNCSKISQTLFKYKGMSYRNMYEIRRNGLSKIAYIESEEYFQGEETRELSDGYTLSIKKYAHQEGRVCYAVFSRCVLSLNGAEVYKYRSTCYSNPHTYFDILRHRNGHRYFLFHIDLYGLSVLDLETLEVYHYIPEGYQHDCSYELGESFIITDVNYDVGSGLIAFGGCYWAAPNDTMIGDFSEPLNFNPHLVNIHEIIDPEYEEYDDVDFVRFDGDSIIVSADRKREFSVNFDEISAKIVNESAAE